MIIHWSSLFTKDWKRLQKEICEKVNERIRIFTLNEFDPLLNNHKLKHEYEGFLVTPRRHSSSIIW